MILSDRLSSDSIKELTLAQKEILCSEIRGFLIENIPKTGGHLASNLGTVELTVALHSVFSTPEDKIIFDVGHQSYTHKMITGRLSDFPYLRTENGISGFPRSTESEHDAFIGGHSSISVSAALGIAKALELKHEQGNVIAVIGDGALTGGEAYEGLNNVTKLSNNLIIVLNDNEMSISRNHGAVADYLTRMRSTRSYFEKKEAVKEILSHTAIGKDISRSLSGTKDLVKYAIYQSNIFESLGIKYYGPVNGHNLAKLIEILEVAKLTNEPCIVHIRTKKGKGYFPAEQNSGEYHGLSKREQSASRALTFSEAMGQELVRCAEKDERICAVTAAMKYATGLEHIAKRFPERFFDVGIAEQHALTFCCGLASQGMLPVFAVYSTFLQRCYDQMIHDASIEKKHVVLCVDRAGFVGEDGETHQGLFDIPMMTSIPGTVIFSPFDHITLKLAMHEALYNCDGLTAVRYPRGACAEELIEVGETYSDFYFSRKEIEHENLCDTLIISYGRIASNIVGIEGTDSLIILKVFPVPEKAVEIAARYKNILIAEECMRLGGIGEIIVLLLSARGFKGRIKVIAADGFFGPNEAEKQIMKAGLDRGSIISAVKEFASEHGHE